MGTTLYNKIPLGRSPLLGSRRVASLLAMGVVLAAWLLVRAWH